MKDPLKLGLTILAVIILGGIAIKLLGSILGFLWGILVPIAVIAGIGLVIYGLFSRKSLGGGRNSLP
jgi:hypothetical protein